MDLVLYGSKLQGVSPLNKYYIVLRLSWNNLIGITFYIHVLDQENYSKILMMQLLSEYDCYFLT